MVHINVSHFLKRRAISTQRWPQALKLTRAASASASALSNLPIPRAVRGTRAVRPMKRRAFPSAVLRRAFSDPAAAKCRRTAMRTHQKPRRRPSERKEGQEAGSMKQETSIRRGIEARTAPPCSQCFSAESFTVTLLRYAQYSNSDDVDTLAVSFF